MLTNLSRVSNLLSVENTGTLERYYVQFLISITLLRVIPHDAPCTQHNVNTRKELHEMLRSSLGFHTMSISLRLTRKEIEQLIKHLHNYCKRTGNIRMLIVNKLPNGQKDYKEYSPKFSGTSLILPRKLEIFFSDENRGIKWIIKSDRRSEFYKEYGIEATINPTDGNLHP